MIQAYLKKHKTDPNLVVLKIQNNFLTAAMKDGVTTILKDGTFLPPGNLPKEGENNTIWVIPKDTANKAVTDVNAYLSNWTIYHGKVMLTSEVPEDDDEYYDDEDDEDEEDDEDKTSALNWFSSLNDVCYAAGITELRLIPSSNLLVAVGNNGVSIPLSLETLHDLYAALGVDL